MFEGKHEKGSDRENKKARDSKQQAVGKLVENVVFDCFNVINTIIHCRVQVIALTGQS